MPTPLHAPSPSDAPASAPAEPTDVPHPAEVPLFSETLEPLDLSALLATEDVDEEDLPWPSDTLDERPESSTEPWPQEPEDSTAHWPAWLDAEETPTAPPFESDALVVLPWKTRAHLRDIETGHTRSLTCILRPDLEFSVLQEPHNTAPLHVELRLASLHLRATLQRTPSDSPRLLVGRDLLAGRILIDPRNPTPPPASQPQEVDPDPKSSRD